MAHKQGKCLMNLFSVLNANNYQTYNRAIAKLIGINVTILLTEIIDKHCFFESKGQLNEGWFYLTISSVEERTALGRDAQDCAIKKLKKLGFIESKRVGMPAKRHFRVIKERIIEWVNHTNKSESPHLSDCVFSSNKGEGKLQTDPSAYIKEPKEESKEEPNEILAQTGKPVLSPGTSQIFFSFTSRFFEGVTAQDLTAWEQAYPGVNVPQELKVMAEWCVSNPAKARSKKQWRRFITNWLTKTNEKRISFQATNDLKRSSPHKLYDRRPRDDKGQLVATQYEGLF